MEFTHHEQPYGTVRLRDCTLTQRHDERGTPIAGVYTLRGIVVSGVQATALACGVVIATRDKTGEAHVVYGVTTADLARGEKTTAYC